MVAKLAFRDLSPEQMQQIRSPKLPQGLTVRDYLAQVAGPLDPDEEPRDAILLDLYIQTLQFGQSLGMTDEKLSGLFSLVKDLHMRSTQQRLTVENAFKLFKNMLLENSIQRPPFSTGLFAYTEMQAVLNWGLDTYFRHYKLYQYAFTHRVTMTVTSTTLLDAIELPPPLQPLAASITQAQHEAQLAEAERVRAEKEAAEQAERDRQAELDRQARIREEYEAAVPDEIKERVAAVVNKEMQMLRSIMEEQFSGQENKLKEKIKQMEATAGKDGDAKPGSRAQSPKTGLRKAAAAGAAGAAGAHS